MPAIQRGQFSDFLRRYLGMTGASDVVDELAPEIAAELTLEVERPEWEFLKGSKLLSAGSIITAQVGLASQARLTNPVGSGVVGIIQPCFFAVATPSQVDVRTNPTAGVLATTVRTNPRDMRMPAVAFPGNSQLLVSQDTGVTGAVIATLNVGVNSFLYDVPIVLTPGFDLNIVCITVNVSMTYTFNWLEKRLDILEQR